MKLEELLTKDVEDDDDDEKLELKMKLTNDSEGERVGNTTEDAAEEESAEKESAGGKKKGTRKKRSLNWEEAERGLLLEVIKSKVGYVENRSVDAKSIKAKRLAWSQITKQFNALNFRHRMLEQIQVQWRSMKNSAKREHQQKYPKGDTLEGMRMIEFMEELQKDPITSRSQTRANAVANGATTTAGAGTALKKELLDLDEDEDMPLAALPNSTNASEDTLQTSTIAIPSPPPSTAGGDSQQECSTQPATGMRRKRTKQSTMATIITNNNNKPESASPTTENGKTSPLRKRRQRKHSQAQSVLSEELNIEPPPTTNSTNTSAVISSAIQQQQQFALNTGNANGPTTLSNATTHDHRNIISSLDMEEKYKKELFKLLKQARLAEIDYARREHEQKLRFEQMEQELKLSYYRQEQDLKLRNMREEHDLRLRQQRREHEARLSAYTTSSGGGAGGGVNGDGNSGNNLIQEQAIITASRCNAKSNYNNSVASTQLAAMPSTSTDAAAAAITGYN